MSSQSKYNVCGISELGGRGRVKGGKNFGNLIYLSRSLNRGIGVRLQIDFDY